MGVGNVHVEVRFFVKGFAADATSPEVDTILTFAQFLRAEHIVGEVQRTLLGHF